MLEHQVKKNHWDIAIFAEYMNFVQCGMSRIDSTVNM